MSLISVTEGNTEETMTTQRSLSIALSLLLTFSVMPTLTTEVTADVAATAQLKGVPVEIAQIAQSLTDPDGSDLVLIFADTVLFPSPDDVVVTGALTVPFSDGPVRAFSITAFSLADFINEIGFGECVGVSRDCSKGIPGGKTFEELTPVQQAAYLHDIRFAERKFRDLEWYQLYPVDSEGRRQLDFQGILAHCALFCGGDFFMASAAAIGNLAKRFLNSRDQAGCEKNPLGCSDRDRDGVPDYKDRYPDNANADPTFVQISPDLDRQRVDQISRAAGDLVARIVYPPSGALIRANVPFFGVAHGKGFSGYKVESRCGHAESWELIEASSLAEPNVPDLSELYYETDLTVDGNLTTWDTGLTNYVYLPTHPPGHPIDLKGSCTVRLVVSGEDGATVEDEVSVFVANAIPNAWGGFAESADQTIRLDVPEQALTEHFRLIGFEAIDEGAPAVSEDRHLVGSIHEVREAGETFTKAARLEIALPPYVGHIAARERLAIYGFDPELEKWRHLPTTRRKGKDALFAKVRRLHGYYAVMASDSPVEGSTLEPVAQPAPLAQRLLGTDGHYLIRQDFEDDMGTWRNRDGVVGATSKLDRAGAFDGGAALKLFNAEAGGNFAVTVLDQLFDARAYPLVQFDYRIAPDVKTDIYVKVAGRWYAVGFTDDPVERAQKRLNIASVGRIENVVADGKWHTARFNLWNMLRSRTGEIIVEEIVMADWDVTGLMKLSFGGNAAGAAYWIDNFSISRDALAGLRLGDDLILIDDFNRQKETNALGERRHVFSDELGGRMEPRFVAGRGDGKALQLNYDVQGLNEFAGFVSELPTLDLRDHQVLRLIAKGSSGSLEVLVGLRDRHGNESKLRLGDFVPTDGLGDWTEVAIPLVAFDDAIDLSGIANVSLSMPGPMATSGQLTVDDLRFERHVRSAGIERFDKDARNLLGGGHRTIVSGAGAVSGARKSDDGNGLYRLSYGGVIGEIKAYASDLFSFAGWRSELRGLDCSRCGVLRFRIRGLEGGEQPNVYLDDGNHRWGRDVEDYTEVTTEWQEVVIPLSDYAEYGVDLTHLAGLEFVFEWDKMTGTVYFDDIRFDPPRTQNEESVELRGQVRTARHDASRKVPSLNTR